MLRPRRAQTLHAVVLALAFVGCATTRLREGQPSTLDFELPFPRAMVFDACLAVAQGMNLNVAVLEKQSGLIRLESAHVAPAELETDCEYFEVSDADGEPVSTFSDMDLSGVLSMTILLSEASSSSTGVDIRANWRTADYYQAGPGPFLGVPVRGVDLRSKGVLENKFRLELVSALRSSS